MLSAPAGEGAGEGMLRRRVVVPLLAVLRQGVTPRRLAACVAVGAVIGTFPVIGTTTALCAAIAVAFRLNQVAIQAANYAVYPLQIVLLIPFMRLGERVTGAEHLPLTSSAIVAAFMSGFGHAFRTLSIALAHAALGWALCAIPAALALYAVMRPVMARVGARLAAGSTPSVT